MINSKDSTIDLKADLRAENPEKVSNHGSEVIFNCLQAAKFLGIGGKRPERAIQKMVKAGKIRGLLASKKIGYRFHRQGLEDDVRMGGLR